MPPRSRSTRSSRAKKSPTASSSRRPTTRKCYFNEYHSRMRPGSHHMLLYIQAAAPPGDGARTRPGDVAARRADHEHQPLWSADADRSTSRASGNGARERRAGGSHPSEAAGHHAGPLHQRADKPILREAWANVVYVDKSEVTQLGDPIFFIAGVTMNVEEGQTTVIHGTAPVPTNAGPDFRLITRDARTITRTRRASPLPRRSPGSNEDHPRQLPHDARAAGAAAH